MSSYDRPRNTYRTINASFASQSEEKASERGPPLLQTTSPLITTALSSAFPYLLIVDKILAAITWTNDDPYQGFLCVVVYVIAVKHWETLGNAIIPLAVTLGFCCTSWTITVTARESSSNPPTLEEVIALLSNICARCEILGEPLRVLDTFTHADLTKLFISSFLLWPFYVFVLQRIYSPHWFPLMYGIVMLTYYSPWAAASRCLLWRSVHVRSLFKAATGLEISLPTGKKEFTTDQRILFTTSDANTETRTVEFQIFENQRRWLGIGWSSRLLPGERNSFTNERLESCPDLDSFTFPELPKLHQNELRWEWLDPHWQIDIAFNKGANKEGWIYYDNYWESPSFVDSISKYTRSRKWRRRATLQRTL